MNFGTLNSTESKRQGIGFLALILAASVVFFWPSWVGLVGIWESDANTYSHGYLLVLVSIYYLVVAAGAGARRSSPYSLAISAALILAGAVWLLAYLAIVQVAQSMLIPVMIYLALLIVFGIDTYRRWIFPLAIFYFAIPVWDYLNPWLQKYTIAINGLVLNAARIPAYFDESLVYLPSGTFEIAAGCSGLHFFIVAGALAAIHGNNCLTGFRKKLAFLCCALGLAMLMNWIRVISIIVAGHTSNMTHYLVTVDHYLFGWVLFSIMIVPLYYIASYIERFGEKDAVAKPIPVPGISGIPTAAIVLAISSLSIAPLVAFALNQKASQIELASLSAPEFMGEWSVTKYRSPSWGTTYEGFDSEFTATFVLRDSSHRLEVYANRYTVQSQGAELINSTNRLFQPDVWNIVEESVQSIEWNGENTHRFRYQQIANDDGDRAVLFFWYVVGGELTASEFDVKRAELLLRLKGRPLSGIVAIKVDCDRSCKDELELAIEFLKGSMADFLRSQWFRDAYDGSSKTG